VSAIFMETKIYCQTTDSKTADGSAACTSLVSRTHRGTFYVKFGDPSCTGFYCRHS